MIVQDIELVLVVLVTSTEKWNLFNCIWSRHGMSWSTGTAMESWYSRSPMTDRYWFIFLKQNKYIFNVF